MKTNSLTNGKCKICGKRVVTVLNGKHHGEWSHTMAETNSLTNQEPMDWEPTKSQKDYWEAMRSKSGSDTPAWKGKSAGKSAMHKWLDKNYGKPTLCEHCLQSYEGKWKMDWALKQGMTYSHNREDYLRLCRSCHRKYDLTPQKRESAVKNLWWKKGVGVPNKEGKNQYAR